METQYNRNTQPRIVDNLPRLTIFKQPILERNTTHLEDVEAGMECSVCNTKFKELDDFFMVWLGAPDMATNIFETPEQFVCENKKCQTTSVDKCFYKLDWYRKYR